MKISKTLFKNLIRCPNFPAIYDMYINRSFHNVRSFENTNEEDCLKQLEEIKDLRLDNDLEQEIFEGLFDKDTGEDLTEIKSEQLEAFQDIFTEVERLAIEQAKQTFTQEIISSTTTYNQKYFEFTDNDVTYYCYLDGFSENGNEINVFEVKATTSKKFDDMCLNLRKNKNFEGKQLPLFENKAKGVTKFIGYDYVGLVFDDKKVEKSMIDQIVAKLCDLYSDTGKYIYDLAIERSIIERALSENSYKINYYLIVMNAEYTKPDNSNTYPIDENGNQLFKIYDFTDLTEKIQSNIIIKRNNLEKVLHNLKYSNNNFSVACEYKKTTQCKFFNICGKDLKQDGSILEYINKKYAFIDKNTNAKKKSYISLYDLINNGNHTILSAEPYIYKKDNLIQYDCFKNNTIYVDKDRIVKALSLIKYPIYHLDFESYNSPLPRFFGEHPYSQSLFQYSLHIEKKPGECDIEKDHYEYLAKDHKDHRHELVEKLINDIDLTNGGTVMVYNQSFEKTRLSELAKIYPQYKEKLDKINNHIYDLYAVLSGKGNIYSHIYSEDELKKMPKFTYYNNQLHGSFSIKKVLPIFTNLSYKDLDVKNGTEAILTYGLLDTLTPKEYEEKYQSLHVYCRQDTWAMVEILKGLRKLINK